MLSSPLGGKYMIKSPLGNSQRRVAGGWWLSGGIPAANCIAAYQPIGATDYATSKTNLANPGTYDATEGTAPDWSVVTGWTFDSTNSEYLDTGIVPAAGWSMIARFANVSAVKKRNDMIGVQDSVVNNRFYLRPADGSDDRRIYGFGDGYGIVAGNLASGVMALTPTKGYLDGIQDTVLSGSWTNIIMTIYLGARNYDLGVDYFEGDLIANAIYDIDISAYVAELTTAMNAL